MLLVTLPLRIWLIKAKSRTSKNRFIKIRQDSLTDGFRPVRLLYFKNNSQQAAGNLLWTQKGYRRNGVIVWKKQLNL